MILITGAAGFIGSALAYALNQRGRSDLILCDAFGTKEKWKNILGLRFSQFINRAHLFEFLTVNPVAQQIDAVIHLGACTNTTESNADFLMENNVCYSMRLCEWACSCSARFVYASSAAVYGDGSCGFSDNDTVTPKLRPLNAYGFSKWMFDMWILEQGLINQIVGLRFFNVFGPNEYHKGEMASVIFRAFPLAIKKGIVRLFMSHRPDVVHGEQTRDFIYIDEVIKVILFVVDNTHANGIFNVGTGHAHTFNKLAGALLDAVGKSRNIEYFPMPETILNRYQYHTKADMTRLQKKGYPAMDDHFTDYLKHYVVNYLVPGCRYYAEV